MRSKKEKQKQLKEWKKIIEEDYDWDFFHLLNILSYKLERMQKFFEIKGCHEDNIKYAKQMKEAKDLLNKVKEEGYTKPLEEIDKKYGEMVFAEKSIEDWKTQKTFHRPKVNKKNEKQYRKDVKAAYKKAEKMKQNDLKKAFDIISKNIWYWWD